MSTHFVGEESAETYRERNRWLVEALRSGQYQQGRNFLERHDADGMTRMCCLGVACRIAEQHGLTLAGEEVPNPMNSPFTPTSTVMSFRTEAEGEGFARSDVPSNEIQAWFGWASANPILWNINDWTGESAATRNDGGQSFERIADAFEYTYLRNDTTEESATEAQARDYAEDDHDTQPRYSED